MIGEGMLRPMYLDSDRDMKSGEASTSAPKYVSYQDVQKHKSKDSCWVIIEGQVYDTTPILDTHPGGSRAILKYAGEDATYVADAELKAFKPVHPPGTLSQLPSEAHLGPVDPATFPKESKELSQEERRVMEARASLPPPSAALNLHDVEELAEKALTTTAWAYYRSAGDDENSYHENVAAFKRFWFRPRVLRKVSVVSTNTTMLSFPSSLPIYITPTALARLGHQDGEMNFTRAAAKEGLIQGLSQYASCSVEEVMSVRHPDQTLIFQMYMSPDRVAAGSLLRRLEGLGFKALMLTVDAIVAGNRELDQRAKADNTSAVRHRLNVALDADVCWEDVAWIKSLTKLPVVIKGIQSVEDAIIAYEHGVQGIVLSNHGGRQLDFSPSPMTLLYELSQARSDLLWRRDFEVFVDGGVTRGTDVLKALCLGARAVGMGRPFLYANGVWGEEGCRRVVQIMREEIERAMRLLGVSNLNQLSPSMVRYIDREPMASRL
ncbi:hypothetical protein GLOTRDRAFT_54623 [Gloeophyllum trabeum ATCC 11539]|uniref:L-lactate dehydrogenase (cytochrome) n=1 Tax=Gloeophyllum trabeum (strain ATCC 11539 / FP-39264 / Madison 617) TaxID=670483 RepID=S7RZZ3_GLOTA|nr:uncharacterized protein GLOTRDRAFT_54623 [Gloeophyllum trabeum ATCC 11539]EPQ58989.1 hypothetical protein GLOTRDRAFT_54623 [Gloeophyllum trabeum ATCC 11539]